MGSATFQNFIETETGTIEYEIILGMIFVLSIMLFLFSEGLPVMYSFRSAVVDALNYKIEHPSLKTDSILSINSTDMESSLLGNHNEEADKEPSEAGEFKLKHFQQLTDISIDNDSSIWICKKGTLNKHEYVIRISKH